MAIRAMHLMTELQTCWLPVLCRWDIGIYRVLWKKRTCTQAVTGMQARATESAENRSANDGERENREIFRSPSLTSLQMHTIPQEHERANTDVAPPYKTVLNAMNDRRIVPRCFKQAKEILHFGVLDNCTGKAILKALKISSAQNANVSTKLKIIAMKMT